MKNLDKLIATLIAISAVAVPLMTMAALTPGVDGVPQESTIRRGANFADPSLHYESFQGRSLMHELFNFSQFQQARRLRKLERDGGLPPVASSSLPASSSAPSVHPCDPASASAETVSSSSQTMSASELLQTMSPTRLTDLRRNMRIGGCPQHESGETQDATNYIRVCELLLHRQTATQRATMPTSTRNGEQVRREQQASSSHSGE